MTTTNELGDLAGWVGKREEAEDICALPLVRRVAALLDRDPLAIGEGDPLPAGWQACVFTYLTRKSDLRKDGHALSDPMMPPVPLPRRMLGGRRVYFHKPIIIGAHLRRVCEIVSITPKTGRSGKLIIVTLRYSIYQDGEDSPVIVEEQDSIFREEATASSTPAAKRPGIEPPGEPDFAEDLVTDPTMLFRYSAICFNTHRIHYDEPYATGEEGYPGLVVNGGLSALLLIDLFQRSTGRTPKSFEYRNTGAVFCGRPIRLCGKSDGDAWSLWIQNETPNVLLEAKIQ